MMRRAISAIFSSLVFSSAAVAQPVSPRIGPFVLDVRGVVPNFPGSAQIADSRGLNTTDLPGVGIGVDLGAHIYLVRWRAVTAGIGGELLMSRARSSAVTGADGQVFSVAVTEHFTAVTPQLSLNFGSSKGWSYLSAGVGQGVWSIVRDDGDPLPADEERLRIFNYGGGARWFIKKHLAFTFDVRFHVISAGTPAFGYPGSPRARLLVMGAGVSLR